MNFVSCTVNPCDVTVHTLGRKKKKEARKRKLVKADVHPNPCLSVTLFSYASALKLASAFGWSHGTVHGPIKAQKRVEQ